MAVGRSVRVGEEVRIAQEARTSGSVGTEGVEAGTRVEFAYELASWPGTGCTRSSREEREEHAGVHRDRETCRRLVDRLD